MVRWGSKCGGSHSRRESVPPRFGACPRAGDVTRGAVTAVARPTPLHLSRSRRLRMRCEGAWASMTTLLDRTWYSDVAGLPVLDEQARPAGSGAHFGTEAVSCQGACGISDTIW